MTTRYAELLRRCETDPDVVGVVLSGSQARGTATERAVTGPPLERVARERGEVLDEWDDLDLLRASR